MDVPKVPTQHSLCLSQQDLSCTDNVSPAPREGRKFCSLSLFRNFFSSCECEHLNALLESIPAIVVLKDECGRWQYANPFALETYHLEHIDYRQKTELDLLAASPNANPALFLCRKTDELTWQTGKPITREEVVQAADGTELYFDVTKIPLYHPDGTHKSLVVFGQDITTRKQAELQLLRHQEQLQRSEERYRTLIEHASDGIFVADNRGYILDVNSRSCSMFGYSRQEMMQLHLTDLIPINDFPRFSTFLKDYCSSPPISHWHLLHKNGSIIPVEITHTVFADGRFLGTMRDISDRRRAEEALCSTSQQITTIMENISAAFFTLDHHGVFTYINRDAERLFAQKRSELLGKCMWDIFPEIRNTDYYTNLQRALLENERAYYEMFFPLAKMWVELYVYPTQAGLFVYARDISKQREAQDVVQKRDQEFKALVENAPDIIARFDHAGRFLYINPAVEQIIGFSPDHYIGKTYRQLGRDGQLSERWEEHIAHVFATGETCHFEYSFATPRGILHFHAKFVPEFDCSEQVDSVLSIVQDITERKKWEEEMARFDRLNLVGEMAASIAHEVRNPMTTVRGFLQMLSNKENRTHYQPYYEIMIEELDRANSIITEFLSLAKNKAIQLTPQSLKHLVNSLLPLLQADAVAHNQLVVTNLADVPMVHVDEKEIRQLILNLTRNGLDAMASSGVLLIRVYQEEGNIVLAVTDYGSGIPPDCWDKIGTPFFTTKEQGTGLGLAVCYSIAARHNATIHFESSTNGTTFYVRFPL